MCVWTRCTLTHYSLLLADRLSRFAVSVSIVVSRSRAAHPYSQGDYRVSKDGHGVVVHSSPLHVYESINCRGKRVEDMLLADIVQCQMELTHFHFISARSLLDWANGKVSTFLLHVVGHESLTYRHR